MKRFFRAASVTALLVALTAGAAWSQSVDISQADQAIQTADGKQLWFVELSNRPTADGGDLTTILAEQATFRAGATQRGIHYSENFAYHTLWNGFSLAVASGDLGKLRRMPGVGNLYPVMAFALDPTDSGEEIELATALHMTGADYAQNTLGLSGAGVKVGIIDTGQDYDHPDLGGDGVARTDSHVFPTARAVVGHDFAGNAWVPGATPTPDDYPDDCNGHGTHVSGIVGANGAIKGVAPGVTFGVYKVFGCGGTTSADLMIAAMEQAMADGMNVVNMSIGSATQWPSYPTAAAAKNLVNHGVVVVAAQGNEQAYGLFGGAAPGAGDKVIGVASYDNTSINGLPAFSVSPDDHLFGYFAAGSGPAVPTSGTFPLVRTGTPSSTADACSALPAGSLTGKIALIRRGTCSFYQKARDAQLAGAVGVVLYNNVAGFLNPSVAGTPAVTIPVVGISGEDGLALDARIAAGPVDLTWTSTTASVSNAATGGFISSFSSWGVSPDLTTKPDIGAPGGFIRSSVPIEQGSYAIFSGTSMASPHVAGAVALLLEAHPNTPSNAVRNILQNSADAHGLSAANPSLLSPVPLQGAGMLDIPGMILANSRIEPGKLSFGETEGASVTRSLTITNNSDHDITYSLGHSPAIAAGPNTPSAGLYAVPLFLAASTAAFSANPVVVPAGGSASVDVTVTANAGLGNRAIFSGYIDVTPDDGSPDYSVPYTGLKGDYQSISALGPSSFGFPWLAKIVGSNFVNQPSGATYGMSGNDFPVFLFHLDQQVSEFKMEAFEAVSGKSHHLVTDIKDLGRNPAFSSNSSGLGFFFTLTWDGSTFHGNTEEMLPNGQYVVKITAVKALGDPTNPAHVQTWTSPVVTIARPDIALESFLVSQPSVNVGDQVTLSATVRNTKIDPRPSVHVEFLDNGATVGSSDIDLAAGESRVVEAAWTVGEGNHHLEVRVPALPEEEYLVNNELELQANIGQTIVGVGSGARVLALAPAKPNPSRGTVALGFSLPKSGPVSLEVFDLAGRRLKSWRWSSLEAGMHSIAWDGRTEAGRMTPAGTVMLRLNAMGRTLSQKAVRLN